MLRKITKLCRRASVLFSALALATAGMTPGVAIAQSAPRTVQLHYGMSPWGYTLLAVETWFCDGTYQYATINFGTITYTETQNYQC